jgi:hypothetical protein
MIAIARPSYSADHQHDQDQEDDEFPAVDVELGFPRRAVSSTSSQTD